MTWRPPERPDWVEELNAMGRHLGGARTLVSLDKASLLAAASAATGLDDYGTDTFEEPLSRLLAALEEEAHLHTVGRLLARSEIVRLLENRLRIEAEHVAHPEIAEQAVDRPLFITGTGRSGTSILHELLAQDAAHRVPRTWEVLYSCPPPRPSIYETDPRILKAHRDLTLWEKIAPEYLTMHENGGDVPQECIFITAHEFASELFGGNYPIRSYSKWLGTADLRPAYTYHRRVLQLLQSRYRGEHWVLKAPSHLSALGALFSVYPDARVVQTHRDPLKVLASLTSLMCTLRWMRTDDVDFTRLAQTLARGTAMLLDWVTLQRDQGAVPAAQILDVRYHDLMRDPIGTIRAVYDHFDIRLTPDVEARMRAYLEAKPQGKHGVHAYTFADTGLDLAEQRARFAAYQQRYGVPSEI